MFLISTLYEFHHQIFDLQFNGLRWLDLVVMFKVNIKHILYVYGSSAIKKLDSIFVFTKAFFCLLVRIGLLRGQTLEY